MSSKVYQKTCAWCGREFTAGRCDAQYCGAKCRSAVYRERKKVRKLANETLALLAEVEFCARDRTIDYGAAEQLQLILLRASQALDRVGHLVAV